jgi:carboxylate-amine ligase
MASSLSRPARSKPSRSTPDFSFGIEEEYFLVNSTTMEVASETPDSLFACLGPRRTRLEREMLQSQLEVSTRPHLTSRMARSELKQLRETAASAAANHGLALLACGTLPNGYWRQAVHTHKPRYDKLMQSLQMIGQRNMLCALHVHVELPQPRRRVEIMSRMLPYVPLFVALSTSSPFWESRPTGLKGYRLAAYDELPRTGLPEIFANEREYDAYLEAMTRSGAIADGTHIWWSLRPAQHYPTLELRAMDSCTRVDDSIAIASLYRAIARHLYLNPEVNRDLDVVDRALAVENKWRAQRYGVEASFVSRQGAIPIAAYFHDLCEMIGDDIEMLTCNDEIDHCRNIIDQGSSADAQLTVFRSHQGQGTKAALRAVSEWVAEATVTA